MPHYIVTGRDARNECSVKVEAPTAIEAFEKAREQLPAITGMERIEPDGSLMPVQGMTFDGKDVEVRSATELHRERGEEQRRSDLRRRSIIVMICLAAAVAIWKYLWSRVLNGR